jgi:hypothetical protein
VIHEQPVVSGGPQAASEEKTLSKVVTDTEHMKNTSRHVLKLPVLVDLQQKVGELVLSILVLRSF